MSKYVVVRSKRGTNHPPPMQAEVVDARTEQEAITISLEGEKWETDDGNYDVWVGEISMLRKGVASRGTTVEVKATLNIEEEHRRCFNCGTALGADEDSCSSCGKLQPDAAARLES